MDSHQSTSDLKDSAIVSLNPRVTYEFGRLSSRLILQPHVSIGLHR